MSLSSGSERALLCDPTRRWALGRLPLSSTAVTQQIVNFAVEMAAKLAVHQHGKSRVRLGRTWIEGSVHHFVEWKVQSMLESDMEHAFLTSSNKGMTATDTQKNTVRSCSCSRI